MSAPAGRFECGIVGRDRRQIREDFDRAFGAEVAMRSPVLYNFVALRGLEIGLIGESDRRARGIGLGVGDRASGSYMFIEVGASYCSVE